MSTLAASMKTLYDAIKDRTIARIVIHDLPLELQLPPFLDSLLHAHEDSEFDTVDPRGEDGLPNPWGSMSVGWRLPALEPWKSLLRVDVEDEQGDDELYRRLSEPQLTAEDNELAEQLVKFLELADVTLSYVSVHQRLPLVTHLSDAGLRTWPAYWTGISNRKSTQRCAG